MLTQLFISFNWCFNVCLSLKKRQSSLPQQQQDDYCRTVHSWQTLYRQIKSRKLQNWATVAICMSFFSSYSFSPHFFFLNLKQFLSGNISVSVRLLSYFVVCIHPCKLKCHTSITVWNTVLVVVWWPFPTKSKTSVPDVCFGIHKSVCPCWRLHACQRVQLLMQHERQLATGTVCCSASWLDSYYSVMCVCLCVFIATLTRGC